MEEDTLKKHHRLVASTEHSVCAISRRPAPGATLLFPHGLRTPTSILWVCACKIVEQKAQSCQR